MSRSALLGWLAALSLLAPSTVASAASAEPATPPVVHTRVTPPSAAPATPRTPPAAPAPTTPVPPQPGVVADRLIVTFNRPDSATATQAHAAAGATPIASVAQGKVQVVRVDPAHRDTAVDTYKRQ